MLITTLKFKKTDPRTTATKELSKIEKKIALKKVSPVLYLQNPVFGIKIFTNNKI